MMYTVFDDIYKLNREIDRMLRNGDYDQYRSFPPVNIYENKDDYIVVVRVPGMSKDDIKLTTKENALKISGERKKENDKESYYLNERFTGTFERNFMFDERIDAEKISADMKDGLLMIKLGKAEEAKPKAITIN